MFFFHSFDPPLFFALFIAHMLSFDLFTDHMQRGGPFVATASISCPVYNLFHRFHVFHAYLMCVFSPEATPSSDGGMCNLSMVCGLA